MSKISFRLRWFLFRQSISHFLYPYRRKIAAGRYWAGEWGRAWRGAQANHLAVEAYRRGIENIIACVNRHDAYLAGDGDPVPPSGDDYYEVSSKVMVLAEKALAEGASRAGQRFQILNPKEK